MKTQASYSLLAQFTAACVALCIALVLTVPGPPAGAAGTGVLEVTKPEGKGFDPQLNTAHFTARRLIGLNETNIDALGQLSINEPRLLTDTPGYATGPAITAQTDASGVARFDGLESGVYQVVETNPNSGNTYTLPTAPFLVYVAEGITTKVTAKNQPMSVTKSTGTQIASPGEEVHFEITTNVPPCDVNGELHQFVVIDELEPRFEFLGLREVRISNLDGEFTLQEGEDHTTELRDNTVYFSLDKAGLSKLADARLGNPETKVHLTLATRVREDADTSTPLSNIARFSPDGYCVPTGSDPLAENQAFVLGQPQVRIRYTLAAAHPFIEDCQAAFYPEKSERVTILLTEKNTAPENSDNWWWLSIALLPAFMKPGSSGSPSGSSSSGRGEGSVGSGGTGASQGSSPEGQPPAGGASESGAGSSPLAKVREVLASTGAAVLWIVGIGIALFLLGLIFVLRRRDEEDDDA